MTMTMRDPEEYQEEKRTACAKCRAAYRERIDILDSRNMVLETKIADLEDQIKELDRERAIAGTPLPFAF